MELLSPQYLLAVAQIIAIDVLLGGDNAVVIALACRRLPERQRKKGILWGVVGAIILRIGLIFCALQLLLFPFLKIAGSLLLLWIGIKLLQPEEGDAHESLNCSTHLFGAVKTIIVADAVMSMDNVIAVAAAAKGEIGLVCFGILVSIPIIVWGSSLVLKLMDRFPAVITLGGALLGWIAGGMAVTDQFLVPHLKGLPHWTHWTHYLAPALGALLVVGLGKLISQRNGAGQTPLSEFNLAKAEEGSSHE